MSLNDDFQKIKDAEQRAVKRLNREEGWIERHPGWTLAGTLSLLGVIIVLLIKACHG